MNYNLVSHVQVCVGVWNFLNVATGGNINNCNCSALQRQQ